MNKIIIKNNRVQRLVRFFVGIYFGTFPLILLADNFDPTSLSIEQLMESEVSTVTRTEQKFSDTAAAAYIITQDDIRRSGVTSIPETLRMVPGVQVARVRTGEWAVTTRGFNGLFANKMLVLMNGRAIYSPTFGGVRWGNYDLVLEDIEKIEVIRGPGASVWGQNAVNGVINIMTKHAEDTQQGLFSVAAGNEERAIIEMRYGDQLDDSVHYRIFGKFFHRDGLVDLQGDTEKDNWTQGRGGFRVDWNSNDGDQLMVEGDGYLSEVATGFLLPADDQLGIAKRNLKQNSGASILARWEHDFSVASKMRTQIYYEYFNQVDSAFGNERRNTFDIEFQNDIAISKTNYFNWGLEYRFVDDSVFDSKFATVDPRQQNLHLVSAFLQDKVSFFDDNLQFTFGLKIQYYTLSDWDYQPSVRLLWKFLPEHRLWASFSRSIRSPSRAETAFNLKPFPVPGFNPFKTVFQGNPKLEEERVLSYELGYRSWLSNRFSFDLALFYNDYENLVTGLASSVDFVNKQIPITFGNGANAQVWGVEAAVDWRPIDPLRLQLSYSLLQINYRNFNFSDQEKPKTDPENQFSFRGSYDFTSTVTFDVWVRYVDSISAINTFSSPVRNVKSYIGLDLRLAWKPIHNLELSIVGKNMNNKAHLEYVEEVFAYPKQLERSVFGRVQWTF